MSEPYALEDQTVESLATFLENTPLSNGGYAPIPSGISNLLAQAICNYSQGLVWDREKRGWVELAEWAKNPDLGDVDVRLIGEKPEQVVKMTHRVTGISVLAETSDEAWKLLKEKVVNRAGRPD
ncbi:hypothetical protein SEA_ARCHIMEDES_23 [Gordonia phage Archimedes]|uniref:Uncharacterized protein n=1 Tax=Gordonia phage Archimedes TaxID=2759389 RepID=A0A7L7SH14_9CAUD|nr:hypothetical protein KCH38_gp23 [Gordonia phage Archimedes]QOC55723.1 hypothetical protein SEA_ARCHIMEDES_23 [Gordonia phage Archimedes]